MHDACRYRPEEIDMEIYAEHVLPRISRCRSRMTHNKRIRNKRRTR